MKLIEAIFAITNATTVSENKAYDADGNEILFDMLEAEALVASNEYKTQRASAYPSIADQLDQIYHEGIDAWKTTIAAVKAEYPKP